MSKIVKKQIREITIVNESKITQKNREIVNKYCEKVFKFGYDKRVIKQINEDYIDTLPYGYQNQPKVIKLSLMVVYK